MADNATPAKGPEKTPVTMSDGRVVEFNKKQKLVKTSTIGDDGSVSVRLDFVNGEEIVLEDEPTAFARAVADLLADASRRRALGFAARRRVEAQYGMASMRSALRGALSKIPVAAFTSAPLADMNGAEAGVRP